MGQRVFRQKVAKSSLEVPIQRRTITGSHTSHTTRTQHNKILKRDKHLCVYCGLKATQVDHVIPVWRGGKSTEQNLVAACISCNKAKGAMLGGHWAEKLFTKWPVNFNAKVSYEMAEAGMDTVAEYRAHRAIKNGIQSHR